jgi:glycosyltransferase involved in cell wall biosynthesis
MSKEIPIHLKEIIDKGFDFTNSDDALLLDKGFATIAPRSKQVATGKNFARSDNPLRVAFCFDGPFLPIRNGASYSLYNLIQNLGLQGDIAPNLLLCYRGSDSPQSYFNRAFRTTFVTPEHYYEDDGIIEELLQVNSINVVQFCSSEGLLNLGPRLKKIGIKIIFDVQNIDFILEERLGHAASQIEKAKQLQIDAIHHSDYVLCRSEVDKQYSIEMGALPDKTGIYNGAITVDDFKFASKRKNPKNLVFLAHMYYEPNENAFNFIAENIVKALPDDYALTVIGITPKHIIEKHRDDKRIIFKQDIDDISTELLQYGIALAPIFEGSGTRLKVLDYLASGIPVIATGLAVEGLKDEITDVISLKETAEEFIEEIIKISTNAALFERRSDSGRIFVKRHYDWQNQLKPFIEAYKNA